MTKPWKTAVEEAADVLGDMLMQNAEGTAEHSYDDIAEAALKSGVAIILGAPPSEARVAQSARALYLKIHGQDEDAWGRLSDGERAFWSAAATAVLATSDQALLKEMED